MVATAAAMPAVRAAAPAPARVAVRARAETRAARRAAMARIPIPRVNRVAARQVRRTAPIARRRTRKRPQIRSSLTLLDAPPCSQAMAAHASTEEIAQSSGGAYCRLDQKAGECGVGRSRAAVKHRSWQGCTGTPTWRAGDHGHCGRPAILQQPGSQGPRRRPNFAPVPLHGAKQRRASNSSTSANRPMGPMTPGSSATQPAPTG